MALIELRKKRGIKYRAILTPIGVVLGAAPYVSCAIGENERGSGDTQICLLFPALGGALAYFLGRALDAKIMHIKVVGGPPQTETTVNSPAQK